MRRGEVLGRPVVYPLSPDPIVQDFATMKVSEDQPFIYRLTKLGVEAARRGKGFEFVGRVSAQIFGGTKDWDKGTVLKDAAAAAGLDLDEMDAAIADGDYMEEIERNQVALDASGRWGVPTMVYKEVSFFGQDRVDTLRWRRGEAGLARA